MAKLKIGNPPKSVSKELTINLLDGANASIKLDFKYRTRSEYADFIDSMTAAIKAEGEAVIAAAKAAIAAAAEAAKDPLSDAPQLNFGPTEAEQNEKKTDSQVNFIMACVLGWDLDIAFDREAVRQLVDETPQAATAIISAYREAMTEGRLGN